MIQLVPSHESYDVMSYDGDYVQAQQNYDFWAEQSNMLREKCGQAAVAESAEAAGKMIIDDLQQIDDQPTALRVLRAFAAGEWFSRKQASILAGSYLDNDTITEQQAVATWQQLAKDEDVDVAGRARTVSTRYVKRVEAATGLSGEQYVHYPVGRRRLRALRAKLGKASLQLPRV